MSKIGVITNEYKGPVRFGAAEKNILWMAVPDKTPRGMSITLNMPETEI